MIKVKKYTLFAGCMIPMKNPQIEAAARLALGSLKVQLEEVEGFTCCPEPWNFKGYSLESWLMVAGRNLSLAGKKGGEVITLCNGCSATLQEAAYLLASDGIKAREIKASLERKGYALDGKVRVVHAVEMLYREIGVNRVAESCTASLKGLRVGVHYGCHLLRPSEILRLDDPFNPSMLDELVEATGAQSIPYREKMACCGSASLNKEVSLGLARSKLQHLEEAGAQALVVTCPACFEQFDLGQLEVNRRFKENHSLPVLHYFQLLALALGARVEEVGLARHKVKADGLSKVMRR